jgi:hypothetical protein
VTAEPPARPSRKGSRAFWTGIVVQLSISVAIAIMAPPSKRQRHLQKLLECKKLQTTVDQASGKLVEDSAYVLDDDDFLFC